VLAEEALFVLNYRPMKCRPLAMAALFLLVAAIPSRALDLQKERGSPFDLAVTGKITGIPSGETRYARWQSLRALSTAQVTVDGEFVHGPQVLTVVYLDVLLKSLSPEPDADTILATCSDGYAAVYTSEFIGRYRPFLVLEINGKGPTDWPPPGLTYNPGPYVVTVSPALVPEVANFPDVEHKKPWGVTVLEVATFADRYKGVYTGKWASISPAAQRGRNIWINSCASCHQGPSGIFGGTKAGKPFEVIAAYAGFDQAYFMKYVRDPKSLVPCAKMEPHPHYTDAELADLIEFITAGQK
jgi:cytochrome c2